MCRFLFTLLLYPIRDEISFTFFTHRKGSAIGFRPRLVLRTHLKHSFYVHLADGRVQKLGHNFNLPPKMMFPLENSLSFLA